MKRPTRTNRAFTLIEMLTVIAIIGILAGLLFPAIGAALKKAKVAKAQTEVKAIETALKGYYTEYGKWPAAPTTPSDYNYGAWNPDLTGYLDNGHLMNVLRSISDPDATYGNGNYQNNPRKISFLEAPTKSLLKDPVAPDSNYLSYVDPWGIPYQVALDMDYNNITEINVTYKGAPFKISVTNHTVAVWSLGPNKTPDLSGDDIRSWE
jgi:prepilin-type N-terminal cleavage/methylation domain-containing protein